VFKKIILRIVNIYCSNFIDLINIESSDEDKIISIFLEVPSNNDIIEITIVEFNKSKQHNPKLSKALH
jgi:hypothetical protein